MNETPLVSVITPSLNQGHFIGRTIESVRAQDYPCVEHIVVDGGSSDETLQILAGASQVRALVERDDGQSDAVNKGLALASGAIVGWLNADDLYAPGALRRVVDFFAQNPGVDLVYGDVAVVDEADRVRYFVRGAGTFEKLLLQRWMIPSTSVFWRREFGEVLGGPDPHLHLVMDLDLWLRAYLRGQVAHVPAVLAAYRVHPAAKSSALAAGVLAEVVVVLDRTFSDPLFPDHLRHRKPQALAGARLNDGVRKWIAGDLDAARLGLVCEFRNGALWRPGAVRAALVLAECVTRVPVASLMRRVRHRLSRRGVVTVAGWGAN